MASGKDSLTEAKRVILEQQAELQRIAASPLVTGTVVGVEKEHVYISASGGLRRVLKPKEAVKAGDGVLLFQETMQIVGVLPDAYSLGTIAVVRDVMKGQAEVEHQGSVSLVLTGGHKLKKGDRVILDSGASVVARNLGQTATTFTPQDAPSVMWEDIGGLEEAKLQMIEAVELPHRNKELFAHYGKRQPRGVLLYGPPGCIDGDAIVSINRAGKGYKLPLRQLVASFNGAPRWNAATNRVYQWDSSIPTMIRCHIDGEIRLRQITAAYPKGVKPVMKLTLSDGKELRLTPDHEVAQPGGVWTRGDNLKKGDTVLTNGTYISRPESGRYLDKKGYWWITSGLRNHPFFDKRDVESYDMPEHRLTAEATLNGLTLDDWLDVIRDNAFTEHHVFLLRKQQVHHKDQDSRNNDPSNLEILTQSEHSIAHEFHLHFPLFHAKEVTVASIVPDGETEVFDITVAEAHNFVANGIVVHNCGKTMLGKAAACALARIYQKGGADTAFMYVKGPEILSEYVGLAEAAVRSLFSRAKEHKAKHGYPAVIFIDEADAILSKRGGFHGGFMEKTIVPMFLSEMDGLDETGALVILTTNRPDVLDPAIVRDGRIDRKIKVTRPTRESSVDILHLNLKRAPLGNGYDHRQLAEAAAEEMFARDRVLYTVETTGGKQRLTLSHVLNGGMLAGVVDHALSLAIRRDMVEKTVSGILLDDVLEAVDIVDRQSRDTDHSEPLEELVQELGEKVLGVSKEAYADKEGRYEAEAA